MSAQDARSLAPVRVLVVENQEVLRRGICDILDRSGSCIVCGEVTSAARAVEAAERHRPDVVVMGLADGIDATREIRARRPRTAVLTVTSESDEEALIGSVLAGAAGHLPKSASGAQLIEAVSVVADGRSLLDPDAAKAVLDRLRGATQERTPHVEDEKLGRLSSRELAVLEQIASGLTNRAIAERLFISEKTVKNHVTHIFTKLEVTRRAEAAAYAVRRGGPSDPSLG